MLRTEAAGPTTLKKEKMIFFLRCLSLFATIFPARYSWTVGPGTTILSCLADLKERKKEREKERERRKEKKREKEGKRKKERKKERGKRQKEKRKKERKNNG